MKITNLDKGEAYQLRPGTQLTIERTNPFFNDYGEQTVPMQMPASDHNLRLIGHPSVFGNTRKVLKADVAISDGDYYATCRQAVLSVKNKGSISTSFYMNDGSLYARMQNVKLKDIFSGEYVKDAQGNTIDSVEGGISFCRSLLAGNNPDYAIFPVLVDDDSGLTDGYGFKFINLWGKYQTVAGQTVFRESDTDDTDADFWGATERTETVGGTVITLSPGYYISPFIRCNTVLKRIFSHFGYTLSAGHFFATTEPFTKMVFINNVIDVLVNGRIRVSDLLPDVSVGVTMDVFRKKFCCEFAVNEANRTVDIVLMKDIADTPPAADLTSCLTEEPEVTFNTQYRRIALSSKKTLERDDETGDRYDNLTDMVKNNPTAVFNPATGTFTKKGYLGVQEVDTVIGPSGQPYNTGEALDERLIVVPDLMPSTYRAKYRLSGIDRSRVGCDMIYVGKYHTLNSRLVTTATDDDPADSESATMQDVILAFAYIGYSPALENPGLRAKGTVCSYDERDRHLWDYSLLYNGDDGLFDRFWSFADLLYRNTLNDVKVKLLLSDRQKMDIPAIGKVIIHNTEFLFDKLKFTIGGKNQPVQSELKTLRILDPEDTAPTLQQLLPAMTGTGYHWEVRYRVYESTADVYNSSSRKSFGIVYPPIPTASLAGTTTQRQICTKARGEEVAGWPQNTMVFDYTTAHVWLECVADT